MERTVIVLHIIGHFEEKKSGLFELTSKHIITVFNSESVIIHNFVLNTIDISKDALYNINRENRNFSALTLSVSQKD